MFIKEFNIKFIGIINPHINLYSIVMSANFLTLTCFKKLKVYYRYAFYCY